MRAFFYMNQEDEPVNETEAEDIIQEESIPVIVFNADQEAGIETFLGFLMSDERELRLRGPAGVGKTFLMKHMFTNVLKDYYDACKLFDTPATIREVAFTATTNKAAEVLASQINHPAQTIHSYLSLRVVNNFSDGSTSLEKTRNYKVRSNILLFIDEASMADSPLIKIIRESFLHSKIVWVGDHSQLAPVFEDVPPIYKKPMPDINLTIPVRNANQPALMNLCSQLRETVATGVFKPIEAVPGVIDYLTPDMMALALDHYFINPDVDARILCYTNKQVNTFNAHVRYIRNLPDHFTVGEHLVAASAYKFGEDSLSVEEQVTVISEDFANPREVSVGDAKFWTYNVTIENMFGTYMQVRVPVDRKHFDDILKYFKRTKQWILYFRLKENFPDLRPLDAATIYKAQGSTYETTFVDLTDVSSCTHANQVARMLYVAVSRPKSRLFLYGQLKPAYGG